MAAPSRFPGGLTTANPNGPLGMFGLPDPTQWHVYFEDFDEYHSGNWTNTTTGTGTVAVTDLDGGCVLLTNSAADNDAVFLDKKGESFLMEAGKPAFFKARFKVSDATQSDLVIGLQVTDTTPLDTADGVYFVKVDGSASLSVVCRKDASTGSTSATAATLSSDTFITVGWYYDGKGSLGVFVNDLEVTSLNDLSTYLPDTELTVSFGVQNGEAVAKTMTVDYIFGAKKR